jgi:predicted ATPase
MDIEHSYRPEAVAAHSDRLVVLSGCSGGGKSSILVALAQRGFRSYEEPGRQVVREQLYIGGSALPWEDVLQFVELTVSRSLHHMIAAASAGDLAFFDRGIVDQVAGLEHLGLPVPMHLANAVRLFRYHRTVFLVPPWREIYRTDAERRHSFDDAVESYEALRDAYPRHGYEVVEVPRAAVEARCDFILVRLGRLPGELPNPSP